MKNAIKTLLLQNLDQLKTEIEHYPNEADIWNIKGTVNNSGGNLCLHLIGNLNYFIGSILGNSSYVRQRDMEFIDKNILKSELIKDIDKTIIMIGLTLDNIDETELETDYPIEIFGNKLKTKEFLFYLTTHLTYHLGQINYHRRMF